MARITYTLFPGLYEPGRLDITGGSLTSGSASKAVFTDFASGDKLVLEGKGMEYDNGVISGGIITKLLVVDEDGEKYQLVEGLKVRADIVSGGTMVDQINTDFLRVESVTRSGKDTIIDFGEGDTVTLLNIKPGQIDETDFV